MMATTFPPAINTPDIETAEAHLFGVSTTDRKRGTKDLGFRARGCQKQMYKLLERHHNCVFVCHRRMGKTRGLVMWLVRMGLNYTADELDKRRVNKPRFMYIAPNAKMAKRIVWPYLGEIAEQLPGCQVTGGDNPTITLPNGVLIEVIGAHNPDNLRGTYVDIVIFDEYAYINSEAYHSVIMPQLIDFNGRALFCSTPAGRNDFYRLFVSASKNPTMEWGAMKVSVHESGVIDPKRVEQYKQDYIAKDNMEAYEREFLCNFDAPVAGAIWGRIINRLRSEGAVTDVPHDPTRKVIAAWDLGLRDDTAIWFFQITSGGRVRVIDYMGGSGVTLSDWISRVNNKPYDYEVHVIPHDAKKRDHTTGVSFEDFLGRKGIRYHIIPKGSPQERIECGRMALQVCIFDQQRCEYGLDALSLYHRKYNPETQAFEKSPQHDWTSHAADAFGYGAQYLCIKLGLKEPSTKLSTRKITTAAEIDRLLHKQNNTNTPLRAMSRRGRRGMRVRM